jgi:hypothetical protein
MDRRSGSPGSTAASTHPGRRITPSPGPSLADFEDDKINRIDYLKRRTEKDKMLLEEWNRKATLRQKARYRVMARSSPFKADQAEIYERNLAKIKAKYRIKS